MVELRVPLTALSRVVTAQGFPPKMALAAREAEQPGQLQADSTAGLGCHEGCGNDSNTMTMGALDGNLLWWKVTRG